MSAPHWTEILEKWDACEESFEWALTMPDPETAWRTCERADWMLWIAVRVFPCPLVVQAACDCAETALRLIKDGGRQMAAILALHVAREWADGREDDPGTVRAAAGAADDAARAAYAVDIACYAAAYAAESVARASAAAYAADAAARAVAASHAADAAADAAACDAGGAARAKALKNMADIVRARIPSVTFNGDQPVKEIMNG